MMAQVSSDCSFNIQETLNSMGRAAVQQLLSFDKSTVPNARTVTESAEVLYNMRGRALLTERRPMLSTQTQFAYKSRTFSKSPSQKVHTTSQLIPKQADQDIDDMPTITIDHDPRHDHKAQGVQAQPAQVTSFCSCNDCHAQPLQKN